MRVQIESPGPLDVESFRGEDDSVVSTPQFYGRGKEGVAAVIRVFDADNNVLRAAKLLVCGATGKISLSDRSTPGKPMIERDPSELSDSKPPK